MIIIIERVMIANRPVLPIIHDMMIEIKEHEPLAPHTIYKIGGTARFFASVKNRAELEEALKFATDHGAPFFIMGAGSNTLVSDKGFDGMVIRMAGGEIKIDGEPSNTTLAVAEGDKNEVAKVDILGERMTADAGVMMARAAAEAARAGLAGFAWAIGVPGTIGGSVRGNAGCFGNEMKDVVESVDVFDAIKATSYKIQATSCQFAYRDSIFKRHSEWVVVSATLKLGKGDSAIIQQEIRAMSMERAAKQDIGAKSCGCIFKNPAWLDVFEAKEKLLAQFPELAVFAERPEIPAAFLIDRAGLKGKRTGHIIISDKHANFFVNEGGGTAGEARSLIASAKSAVQEKYGIVLQEEIQYLGF
ncbi:MAG: UDP-N-acetylmuramate dehydrogenase [Candidatus Sungiibacteriota bacterium]